MADKNSITIDGEIIPCSIEVRDIFELQYYKENPRIHFIISSLGENVTQEDIEKEMWGVDSTKKLFRDIKRNDGLLEEIIVKDNLVIEGNTRLCAYRKLFAEAQRNNDSDGLQKWKKIRAKILPAHVTQTHLFSLLGTLHVRGKTEWRPFEQAGYVYRMSKQLDKTPSEISSLIGIGETEVKRQIKIYEIMQNRLLDEDSSPEALEKYSYFDEYFKSREMQKLHAENPELIDNFCTWVKEERIYKAHQQVKDLAHILQHKKARKIFIEEDTENAFDMAKEKLLEDKPAKGDPFYNQLEKTRQAIRKVALHQIKKEIDEMPKKGDIIQKLHKELTRFCHNLGMSTKVHVQ